MTSNMTAQVLALATMTRKVVCTITRLRFDVVYANGCESASLVSADVRILIDHGSFILIRDQLAAMFSSGLPTSVDLREGSEEIPEPHLRLNGTIDLQTNEVRTINECMEMISQRIEKSLNAALNVK